MKKKQKMLSQCCVCRKVKRKEEYKFTDRVHMDKWDHHHNDLQVLNKEFDVVFSHGYCEECIVPLKQEIEELRQIRNNAFAKEMNF